MIKIKELKPGLTIDPLSLHHALCTLLIAALAYAFLYLQPSAQANWLILSCLLLSQAGLSAEANWHAVWQFLYYPLCGLLAAAAVLAMSVLASYFWCSVLLLAILTFTSSYLGWRQRHYFFATLVINILAILAFYFPGSMESVWQRFSLIMLGSVLILIVRGLSFVFRRRRTFVYAKILYFQKLNDLYQFIFYISARPNSLLGKELEESHYQTAWADCLSAMQLLKSSLKRLPSAFRKKYLASIERMWDLSLSLGSIRYRLSDYSVLSMGQNELQSLLQAISAILAQLSYSHSQADLSLLLRSFEKAIQDFEELYQSMLQTVAKEPLVLLLFIQDLYALKEEIENLDILSQATARGEVK